MANTTICPDCDQLVGILNGRIALHRPRGKQGTCPGSDKKPK